MMGFRKRRQREASRSLAEMLAARHKAHLERCSMPFSPHHCEHCVHLTYKEMRVKVFVFSPFVEVCVNNFSYNKGERFSVNEPQPIGLLTDRVETSFEHYAAPVFAWANPLVDWSKITEFCADPENECDLIALELDSKEFLMVSLNQLSLRVHADATETIDKRLEVLSRLFHRYRQRQKRGPEFLSEREYHIQIGRHLVKTEQNAGERPGSLFGTWLADKLPPCSNCKIPLELVASIDVSKLEPEISRLGPILYMMHCSSCEVFDYPLFVDYSDPALEIVRQEAAECFIRSASPLEARELTLAPVTPRERGPTAMSPPSKLGGMPDWIQSEWFPECLKCEKTMCFAAQLASDPDIPQQFGDSGVLYVFVCLECKIAASFIQSH